MKKKILIWILAIVLAVAGGGTALYFTCPPVKNTMTGWYNALLHKQPAKTEQAKQKDTDFITDLQTMQAQIAANNAEISKLQNEVTEKEKLVAVQEEIDLLEVSIANLKKQITELESENADASVLQDELNQKQALLNSKQAQINATLNQDIETLNNLITVLKGRIMDLETANQNLRIKIAELENVTCVYSGYNLLINGDFNINQRNITSGSGTGYFIDRWKGSRDDVGYSVDNGVVTVIAPANNNGYIKQFVEQDVSYKTLTVSAYITENTGARLQCYTRSSDGKIALIENSVLETTANGIVSKTFTVEGSSPSIVVYIGATSGHVVSFEWAKLEIGSVATEFVPRLDAEELVLCQRYFQIFNKIALSGYAGPVTAEIGHTTIYVYLPYVAPMRTNQTVIVYEMPRLRNSTVGWLDVAETYAVSETFSYGCLFAFVISDTRSPSDSLFALEFISNSSIVIDAEIY